MKTILFSLLLLVSTSVFAQRSSEYSALAKSAMEYYDQKDYKTCAEKFKAAFATNNGKGTRTDKYNAACCGALSGNMDDAFEYLKAIATKGNYTNLRHITSDTDLNSLHEDARWTEIIDLVKANKEEAEKYLDKELVTLLEKVHEDDQKYRQQISGIQEKHGWESKEMKDLLKVISEKDSLNQIIVTKLLDERGWLGSDVVGGQGNSTLFLVIQHADIDVQLKYLPMMREAVKNGKARGSSLALLEDRVALRQGNLQIYGSQVGRLEDGTNYVLPLKDPETVDERRKSVGLGPLADYVGRWDIKWDPAAYKKELPKYIEIQKRRR